MTESLKIRRVGNSLGVILTQGVLHKLNLKEGDELFLVQTPDGFKLTPFDPDFAEAVQDARAFMHSHRNAFRELSK